MQMEDVIQQEQPESDVLGKSFVNEYLPILTGKGF